MVKATLDDINAEMLKYADLAVGIGDTRIIKNAKVEKFLVKGNQLVFEEDHVYMYLSFNSNLKTIKATFCLTEIDTDYVETLLSKIGLSTTEENVQNYSRDPTMIEKFWNHKFIKSYNEIFKYLRRSKIKYLFKENFKPMPNKNRFNEVVY